MKQCNLCGELKYASEFYAHKQSKDGLQGKCKECAKSVSKRNRVEKADYYKKYDAWRFKNDPRVKSRHKRYLGTEKGIDSMRKSQYLWINNNPDKRAAHVILGNAVRDGRILKPDHCSKCGEFQPSRNIHAHHNDYSKPLDVVWLCVQCHVDTHSPDQEENS